MIPTCVQSPCGSLGFITLIALSEAQEIGTVGLLQLSAEMLAFFRRARSKRVFPTWDPLRCSGQYVNSFFEFTHYAFGGVKCSRVQSSTF